MRIILDNGAHTLRNMGDVAMLQTAIKRIRDSHPAAELAVLTTRPDLLPRYCPGTKPLSAASRNAACLPADSEIAAWKRAWKCVKGLASPPKADPAEFLGEFAQADAVLVAGGGFLNDLNPLQTQATLRMVLQARKHGKLAGLFGQGLGPLTNGGFINLLKEALQTGCYLGVREGRRGPQLVNGPPETSARIAVTGDDAVELGSSSPPALTADLLGFSARQVDYSGMQESHLLRVREGLERLQATLATRIVGLPISFNSYEDDPGVIAKVTSQAVISDGLDDPAALIQAASRCRLVVTGTYHAAVFALSQGVPALCFHSSPYYQYKIEGLVDQFPNGCELVDLSRDDAVAVIARRGVALWQESPALQPVLRAAAARQTRDGRAFYAKVLQTLKPQP